MELELRRHEWSEMRAPYSDAVLLPTWIVDLYTTTDEVVASGVGDRISELMFAEGQLSQASPVLASALVHALWRCHEIARETILLLLSEIAGGFTDDQDPDVFGPVSVDECLREIRSGFPAYVEVLDSPVSDRARTACVDLLLMCGLSDAHLKSRVSYYFESVLSSNSLPNHRDLVRNSLKELMESS